jgi:dihydroxyacid dehydratase/phosphogluconate dehydratase
MIFEDLAPARILTREAFLNAARVHMALGGSTNAVVHLIAMARRAGVALMLDDLDAVGRQVPVLANLFPSGDRLMEDFFYAGGLPALMSRLRDHLSLDELTVTGRTLRDNLAGAEVLDPEVIRPLDRPVSASALAVLHGNLAPAGAVMKPSAADPRFLQHSGPALVFDSQAEMLAALADPELDCDENTVLVLRNAGPWARPACPNGATCRSRRSCCSAACATWCACPTRA